MTDIFAQATAAKLRFTSAKGQLSVEQLWDLPLTTKAAGSVDLDTLAKAVNREIKAAEEESFVVSSRRPKSLDVLRLDILKYIIAEKLAAQRELRDSVEKAEKKKKLLEALAKKGEDKLNSMSEKELLAELSML